MLDKRLERAMKYFVYTLFYSIVIPIAVYFLSILFVGIYNTNPMAEISYAVILTSFIAGWVLIDKTPNMTWGVWRKHFFINFISSAIISIFLTLWVLSINFIWYHGGQIPLIVVFSLSSIAAIFGYFKRSH